MADISSELAFRITERGSEEVRAGLMGIDQATKQTSQSTSTLTKFVREQRAETRQANFLFRESRQVISSVGFAALSLASATSSASKEMQKVNQVLVSGFSAFQASSFALSAMGVATGGWGLAISGILALGAGFLSFMNDAAETTEELEKHTKEYANALREVENLTLTQTTRAFTKAIKEQAQLEDEIIILMQKKVPEAQMAFHNTELDKLRAKLAQVKRDVDLFGSLIGVKSLKEVKEQKDEGGGDFGGGGEIPLHIQIRLQQRKIERDIDKKFSAAMKKAKEHAEDITDSFEKQFHIVGQLSSSFSNLQSGMQGLGIETDSWLSKLIGAAQTLASIYEIMAAIKALVSIFSLGAGAGAGMPAALPKPPGMGIGGSGAVELQKSLRNPTVRKEMAAMITDLSRKGRL